MSEVRCVARMPDGSEVDITEGVQTIYDLVIGSLDWGSGFLTVEDALPVVHVAKTCGFADWEEAQAYVDAKVHAQESEAFRVSRIGQPDYPSRPAGLLIGQLPRVIEHDHVFSSVGECMWPRCKARPGLSAAGPVRVQRVEEGK